MPSRQYMKPRSVLDDRREEIRASLAATLQISKTSVALKINPNALRNYLRANRDLLPEGMKLYQKSPLYGVPKERITALLRKHTIEQTANLLGVRTSQLSSFLCRFPSLRPPEVAVRNHTGHQTRTSQTKYRPLDNNLSNQYKDIKLRDLQLFAAFKEINILENFLKVGCGIMPDEYFILMVLNRSKEPVTSSVLYETLSVSPSRISRYLVAMEGKKLVQRTMDPDDKRLMLFTITPEGRALFKNIENTLNE